MKWTQRPLGELGEFKNGLNYSHNNDGIGLKVINVSDFKDLSRPNIDALSEINPEGVKVDQCLLQKDDIIFVRSNGNSELVGRSLYIPDLCDQRVSFSGFCIRFRPNGSSHPPFLGYFFRSQKFRNHLSDQASGTNIRNLNQDILTKVKVPIPPLPVQKKIADILSAYDDLIEVNRRSIQLLEESARRLYKEWFVQFRFPNHEKVKMVDGLPEGWKRTTIDQVCDTLGGGTPSTTEPSYWQDGTIPWFTPKDLSASNSLILLDSEKKITEKGLKESSAKLFNPFTILMSSRASIGYFGLFDGYCASNQGFIAVVPKVEAMRLYLLYDLMARKEEIEGKATGTTFKEISKTTFRALEVIEPSLVVLNAFNDLIWPLLRQVQLLAKETSNLEQARDRLLPRMMSGTMSVSKI